ncbi:MAG: PhnD/SsuA/transferrin family substrate-binding protein [bacterium]
MTLFVALLLPVVALLWGEDALAQPAAPTEIKLGIFAPNSGFTSGSSFSYITGLARHVQSVTGITTSGNVWRNAGAFRRALGGLHFAVVDPIFLCRRRLAVVASGRLGGGSKAAWGLFVRSGISGLSGLRGKRIALAASGSGDVSFAEGMLGGRLALKAYFSGIVYRKDLRSAINAVKAGQAEAVLAPVSLAKGLRKIYSTPSVPNAGLAVIKTLPPDIRKKVSAAIRGYGASGVGGWGGVASYSCPSGRVRFPVVLVNQRYVPPAQAGMIRKLQPGKGYRLAPILDHFRVR